jgi:hypothetical protein
MKNAGEAAAPFQKEVIQAIIELWQDAWKKNPNLVDSILTTSFWDKLIFWGQRSIYYYEGISFLYQYSKNPDAKLNNHEVCAMILLTLPQEMEGPVKEAFLLIGYLKRICDGGNRTWEDYSTFTKDGHRMKKMLGGAINEARDVLQPDTPLFELIDSFDPKDHSIRGPALRNSIAHSNWIFVPGNKTFNIRFFIEAGFVDIEYNELFKMILRTQDLVSLLNTSMHLGIRRIKPL